MAEKTILGAISQRDTKLTPEEVVSKLFWFHSQAHFLHLQTTSFSEHTALNKLYKALVDIKDEVSEQLLGYIERRLSNLSSYTFTPYSEKASTELCNQIIDFAYNLRLWAESLNYENISNLAQELSGLAASTKYLLTLKK